TCSLPFPKERFVELMDRGTSPRDNALKYAREVGEDLTPEDVAGFGDQWFERGRMSISLEQYKIAEKMHGGRLFPTSKYWERGLQVLEGEESYRFSNALDFLDEHDSEGALQKIVDHGLANITECYHDFADFCQRHVESMDEISAQDAASVAYADDAFQDAAIFYKLAGDVESAKRMGLCALQREPKYSRPVYAAKDCFETAGDEEGLAMAKFLDDNFR
ncbi:hypothetical protein ACFL3V_06155, partial [Nanoarchaeota archaeon]